MRTVQSMNTRRQDWIGVLGCIVLVPVRVAMTRHRNNDLVHVTPVFVSEYSGCGVLVCGSAKVLDVGELYFAFALRLTVAVRKHRLAAEVLMFALSIV